MPIFGIPHFSTRIWIEIMLICCATYLFLLVDIIKFGIGHWLAMFDFDTRDVLPKNVQNFRCVVVVDGTLRGKDVKCSPVLARKCVSSANQNASLLDPYRHLITCRAGNQQALKNADWCRTLMLKQHGIQRGRLKPLEAVLSNPVLSIYNDASERSWWQSVGVCGTISDFITSLRVFFCLCGTNNPKSKRLLCCPASTRRCWHW